ncbi:glycosyltransferase family 25 protein [Rhizobium sp. LCM 4573]|uniref:glycosyltransferase family 25 protein n=1 Tax=Rhizobium sp. LCM 4573 TaxID=1848291 RepID=UPI0008D8F993|nr:glycosyltransferase family 25 protein [Rhizobium sp. LCM 4573]OHV81585.1 hypothetical protein LCM4573_21105 [Rhizobium sp. LCM 4573]
MQILVINLDRSTDRWRHMQDQFAKLGLACERIPAIDGRQSGAIPLQSGQWRFLKPTEIACFLSHGKCWEYFLEGNSEYAAVFEDDIYLSDNAADILSGRMAIPRDIGILKLETFASPVRLSKHSLHSWEGYDIHRLHSSHFGAAGYIMSRRAAEIIVSLSRQGTLDPVDTFLFGRRGAFWKKNEVFQLSPAICVQSTLDRRGEHIFQTTIEYENPIRRRFGLHQKAWREISRVIDDATDMLQSRKRTTAVVPFGRPAKKAG